MKPRNLAIAASAAGLGVAGFFSLRTPAEAPVPPVPPSSIAAQAPSPSTIAEAPIEREPGCRFDRGATLGYELVGTMSMKLDEAKGRADQPPSLVRTVRVVLDLEALGGEVLLAHYREVDSTLTAEQGDLGAPFLLRVDARCQIAGFAALDSTNVREARAQQAMAHNLVWSWPKGTETRDGANDYGEFRATYKDVSGARPRVQRTIDAYRRVWSDDWDANGFVDEATPALHKERKPLASAMTIEPGAGPWFASLDGSERLRIGGAEVTGTIRAASVPPGDLGAFPHAETRYVWRDFLHRRAKPTIAAPLSAHDQKEIAEVRTLPLAVAMDRYRARMDAGEGIAEAWTHLKNYFVARPEAATEVALQVRAQKLPEDGAPGVFIALGKTPTPEALGALMAIKGDAGAQAIDRSRAAFALVAREDVGVELAQALHADSRGIATGSSRAVRLYARHAALALGMMGSLRAEDAAIVAEARSAVNDILANGRSATTLRPGFGAIANLGDPSLLAKVTPYTRHADADVRRAATIAIRRMPPSATISLSTDWLVVETDPDVRRDLWQTIRLQHLDARQVVDRALVTNAIVELEKQPSALTRQSLVHILGEAKDRFPEAKGALLAAVPRELEVPKEGIFELLLQYLSHDDVAPLMGDAR
ncbi:MAG: hypothetical protein KF795_00895 [Labilithrix sp.]|nr:hypothetical protein [Labilithrix sp.]